MNGITYGMIKEEHFCKGATRISYGVGAYSNYDPDETATLIESISDVSADRKSMAEFVEKCNNAELSVYHLRDVVEDFIVD